MVTFGSQKGTLLFREGSLGLRREQQAGCEGMGGAGGEPLKWLGFLAASYLQGGANRLVWRILIAGQASSSRPEDLLSLPPTHLYPFWPLLSDELEGECLAQLLRRFSSDFATSQNISLDAPLARHLPQCFYHLRLFRKWLVSGQGDLESLDGRARHSTA